MSSTLIKFAAIAIVLIVLLQPFVESMDSWDGAGPSNDTELTLVGLVIGAGVLLALRLAQISRAPSRTSEAPASTLNDSGACSMSSVTLAISPSSPSPSLRI